MKKTIKSSLNITKSSRKKSGKPISSAMSHRKAIKGSKLLSRSRKVS